METFGGQPATPEITSSREAVIIKGLRDKNPGLENLSEDEVRDLLATNQKMKVFKLSADSVIAEMRNSGYFKAPDVQVEEKLEVAVEPEMISNRKKLEGIKEVEDPELKEMLDQNLFYEELDKDFFETEEDLNLVYAQSLSLEKNSIIEGLEYYEGFEFLVKGGLAEIDKDLKSLAEREESFKKRMEALPEKEIKRLEKSKKIATIVEQAIAYAVTDLGWYGDNMSLERTSHFDDVKRSTDEILQITEENTNSFLGLGVDATYRGYLSQEYANKVFKLLGTIEDGYETSVKYFTNHQGEKMEEFSIPKIVLYFDKADVKNLIDIVRNSDDAVAIEKLKNSPQKVAVLNQTMALCDALGGFAEKCENKSAEGYRNFTSAVRRLGEKNPEIQSILDAYKESDISKHVNFIIEQYKKGILSLAA